jgi:hypothetical protein
MAALFGYLLAIAVFIGSGYAGLVWLTSPPSSSPPAPHNASLHQHHPGAFSKRNMRFARVPSTDDPNLPAASAQQSGDSGPAKASNSNGSDADHVEPQSTRAQELAARSTAPQDEPGQQARGAVSSAQAEKSQPDLRRGACTPIGVTAQGDLVFPVACQKPADLPRSLSSEHRPEQPAAPAERGTEAARDHALSRKDADLRGKIESAREKAPSKADGGTTVSEQPISTRKTRQSAERMDGTAKQEHSSPMSRSGMVLSQSDEWFNPLGLH